jgi:N-acetylgalactosamine-N,N'-diacetylbacillosaminyl-diphospho-undecaprenol 4-alpha-N-acetylgalactosaminyltransferase
VVLESLAIGTPVIAFDCKSGPSEMIIDGVNGILVEDQNFDAFTKAMDKMINDSKFYKCCKANASNSVDKFSEEKVIQKWIKLIDA